LRQATNRSKAGDVLLQCRVMAKAAYLGEFEQLVLLAIVRLGEDATGGAIRQVVSEGSQRVVWIGAVHTTLDRLEVKGLVQSRVVPADNEHERSRKTYRLRPEGQTAITRAYRTWAHMTRGLKPKLEKP
jgi:PadR family transcriptional regulator PadR